AHDLGAVRSAYPDAPLQGNVDNALLRTGTPEQVASATKRCIDACAHHAHVLNLGHGIFKDTPVENVEALIATARTHRAEAPTPIGDAP
ncbi:MAG: uroporphyrinogen decarboxylase family protein, partial [Planctomycetota bacterium]